MDSAERSTLVGIANRVKNERLHHNNFSQMYEFLRDVEDDIQTLIRKGDDSAPLTMSEEMESCLQFIRRHPALNKADISRFLGVAPQTLTKAVNRAPTALGKPSKVPLKYLPKLVEFLTHYGYKQ